MIRSRCMEWRHIFRRSSFGSDWKFVKHLSSLFVFRMLLNICRCGDEDGFILFRCAGLPEGFGPSELL